MAVCLIEEGGKFRLYNEEAGNAAVSLPPENFNDIIERLDGNQNIKLFLDLNRFYIRSAVLPSLSGEKTREVLPFEMEGKFLSPSALLVLDYLPLQNLETGIKSLVFAVEKETVKKYLEPLFQKGFNVVAVSPKWAIELEEFAVDETGFYKSGINFITPEFKGKRKKQETLTVFKRAYLYALAVLLIFITGFSVRQYFIAKKENRLKMEIAAVYNNLFPGQKLPDDLYYGIRAKLTELKQNHSVLKGIEALEILKNIGEQAKEGIKVKELNMDGDKVTLKGEAGDYGLVEQFKNGLKKSYPKAQLLETKNQADGKASFAIEVGLNE